MLKLSENAAAALENIRASQGVPAEQGTRLTGEQSPEGGLALRLEFVDEVPETDQAIEEAGTEIYLDSRVVAPLENTTMDVRDTEDGLAFVFSGRSS